MSDFDVFISAVTSECGAARDRVAIHLRNIGLRVAVQEDFSHLPEPKSTLQKLHDHVRNCAEVLCILGQRSGACPSDTEAEPFAAMLPPGFDTASYTQWECFFALHYGKDLFLYTTGDNWKPDKPAPTGPDRPDLQQQVKDHLLKRLGRDRLEKCDNADALCATVLVQRAGVERWNPEALATGAAGGVFAGLLLWALTRWAGTFGTVTGTVADTVCILGAAAFFLICTRYTGILTRRGRGTQAAYELLRHRLAHGGRAAETYARRLTAALRWVDGFFDPGRPDDAPPPTWTAPSYDRCLLVALIYPVVTVLVLWVLSGHVGPAERALLLPDHFGFVPRAVSLIAMAISFYCLRRGTKSEGWTASVWTVVAGVFALACAFAVALSGAVVVAFAVTCAVAFGVAGVFGGAVAVAFAAAFAVAVAVAFAFAVAVAVEYLSKRSVGNAWHGRFLGALTVVLIVASLAAPLAAATSPIWAFAGSWLLFLGLLTLVNAPFDWAALGLTRWLLRTGLRKGGWWPCALGAADAVIAAGVIALLTVVCVAAVDIFNTMALLRGGPDAIILPLGDLFDGIEKHPGAPEYWWVYMMLLSTMIPSLINLIIGGTSLFRGIPPVNALLLRNMPERHEPGAYDRTWMACLLTGQIFLGGLLGIAAQGLLVYVMIWQVLPLFHDGLLNLARDVAEANVPLWLLAPFLK